MTAGRITVGHPVDVGSGAVFTLSTDFALPGSLQLRWTRHYSTVADSDTWLGIKWTVPYFMSLERGSDQYVLDGAHGEKVTFLATAGPLTRGAVLPNLTANMELRREDHYYSVLHWHTGGDTNRFYFEAKDEKRLSLAWVENLAGHRIRVEYDPGGRPVRLIQELERRVIEIAYAPSGLISTIYFAGKNGRKLLIRYEYDRGRRLIAAFDAMGHRKGYEYDRENRMIAETNPLGSRFVFKYDRLGRCTRTAGDDGLRERKLQYLSAPPMTRVTDSYGGVTKYYLNPAGQVVQIVNPAGGVTTKTFDEHGRLTSVTNPDGAKESYAYDDKGNRAASVDPAGAKTAVEHNDLHAPVAMVDRNGNAWKLPNKFEGSLTGVENLPRRVWNYSWDPQRLVAQARSPRGWVIQIHRDGHFRWQENRDEFSLVSRTEFDEFGYATAVLDAEGVITRTSYDDLHRVVEIQRGALEETHYQWNPIGQMTERIGPGNRRDIWQYDRYGYLVAQTNSLGDTVRFEYDKEGKLRTITNRVGERLEYVRDIEGRIIQEKLFDGRIQTYEYDVSGRRIVIGLSDGRSVRQSFDPAGRLLSRKASYGLVEEFEYDKEGRVVKAANGHSAVELKRDRFGRIIEEIQNGRKVRYRYDADGNRIRRSLPFAVAGCNLTRVFDLRGRLLALEDERGSCQEFRWDNVDRIAERRCPGGVLESLFYDDLHRVLEQRVESTSGRVVRKHTYDPSGNLAVLEDNRRAKVHYDYDALNRLKEARRGQAVVETYDYDANQAMRGTHRGSRSIAPGGRVLQDGSREIEYGNDGAVAAMRSGQSTVSLKHDVNGRLIAVSQSNGTVIRYEYDPFGRRTAKIVGEERTEFLWEGWALAAEIRGGEVKTVYVCGDLRPLAQWNNGRRLTPILDRRGAVQEVFDESGRERWSCSLDAYGNLLSEKGDSPNPFRLRGQYQDAETGLYYNFNRHYDPALGDYTAPDPIGLAGGYHFYAYPRNPLRWDDPFGLECPDDDPDKDKNHPPDDDPDKPKEGGPPPVGDPPEPPAPGTPAPGGPGSGPHSSGTEDPPLTGADPNSVYTRTYGDGSVAVQNTVYDENGNAVAHVDFKPHGPDAPSGHAHDFPPGGPVGGGHGPGAEHTPPADVPPDWSRTGGVPPAYPIGATQK
jgi:RHS repeat-associated protein